VTVTTAAPTPISQSNVKLLADFSGGAGGNEARDRSFFGNTPTLAGTAVIQDTQQWFGCNSAADTGSAGTIIIPLTSASFGASADFAIEWYMFTDTAHATDTLIQVGVSPNLGFRLRWDGAGNGELGVSLNGTTYATTTFTFNNSSGAGWSFCHLQRSGGLWSFWTSSDLAGGSGTPQAPNNDPATRQLNAFNPGGNMHVGGADNMVFGAAPDFSDPTQNYLDSMRITIGEVYYSGVPATIPIPAATQCDTPFPIPDNPDNDSNIGLGAEEFRQRASKFVLDGHTFYVIRLGELGTWAYDLATGQWAQWSTLGQGEWNAEYCWDWFNGAVCGDRDFPVIRDIDATSTLDEEVKSIKRTTTGLWPHRGRSYLPCDIVLVTASVGSPDVDDIPMSLSFSDDYGNTFSTPVTVALDSGDFSQRVSYRSLGSIRAPGRVFELTDTGGAVRIDSVWLEAKGAD